ncbi:hypothetical protein SK128_005848 [Halocaridina rubra]|uniref:Uncharacterized protein n=1 Tax=Halocaridina rubra TaxID=373956 RepID=A0AAN9A0U0_HALRR
MPLEMYCSCSFGVTLTRLEVALAGWLQMPFRNHIFFEITSFLLWSHIRLGEPQSFLEAGFSFRAGVPLPNATTTLDGKIYQPVMQGFSLGVRTILKSLLREASLASDLIYNNKKGRKSEKALLIPCFLAVL